MNEKSNRFKYFLLIFCIVIIPYILIIGNFRLILYGTGYYQEQFVKNGVYIETPNADSLLDNLLGFLKSKNELGPEYNDRESSHMNDVRFLMTALLLLFYTFVILLIGAIYLLINKYKLSLTKIMWILASGSIFTILIIIAFYVFQDNFVAIFDSFHLIFFKGSTWVFSSEDTLIKLFPLEFFYDISYKIFYNSLVSALSLFGICIAINMYYNYYLERNTTKQ